MKLEYYKKVLADYHNCLKKLDCRTCKANDTIEPNVEGGVTYCDFLRMHRKHAEEVITKAMDMSL